ncbi:MAG TPA: hypothetical protein PLL78_05470 [Fimbriimonadaceae bacterium]|nr:hypothetical protein [Fimbriimonadaceae bacterium]HRJ96116.1 hypothetical protein [Fimbriimonadaceae bacterium]
MRAAFACLVAALPVFGFSADEVFVGDSGTRRIHVFRSDDGTVLGSFTHPNLVTPWAIAVGSSRVYVLDQLGSTLYVFDRFSWLPMGTFAHGLTFALHLGLASNGDVLLGTTGGRAVRFSAAGALVAEYVQPMFTTANKGVAEGPDGEIYSANFGASRFQRFTASGLAQGASADSAQSFVDAEGLQIEHGIGYVAHSGAFKVSRFAVGDPPLLLSPLDLLATFNHFLFDVAPGRIPGELFACGIDWHGASPVAQVAKVDASNGVVLGTFGHGVLSTPRSIAMASPLSAALVSGSLELQDWQPDEEGQIVQIEIRQGGSVVHAQPVVLGAGGVFSVTTPVTGSIEIAAKAAHWLRQSVAVLVPPEGLWGVQLSLIDGDVDGDNEIAIGDYAGLSSAFGSAPGDPNWNPAADLDGDESVDIGDFAILSQNFGQVGDD